MFATIIPAMPATAASINPARPFLLVQQLACGGVVWGPLPVSRAAEFLASVLAAFAYIAISRTRDGTRAPVAVPSPQTTTAA